MNDADVGGSWGSLTLRPLRSQKGKQPTTGSAEKVTAGAEKVIYSIDYFIAHERKFVWA